MYIVGYFLMAFANVLNYVLMFFMIVVIARAVLSWVSPDPFNPIVRFIHTISEPILYEIRKRLPVYFGGIDLSPIVVILALIFLQQFLIASLLRFSQSLL